jgi:hypothetical protein
MVTSIDSSLLTGIFNARAGVSLAASGASSLATTAKKVAPTAPWTDMNKAQVQTSTAVKAALAGRRFIDEGAAQLDLKGASADYRKLFALYQGLATLSGLAEQAQKKNIGASELHRLQSIFAKGMAEVGTYARTAELDKVRLTTGEVAATAKTTVPVVRAQTEYVTSTLHTGAGDVAVDRFQGNVEFTIKVKRSGATVDVNINLADMGGQTRTVGNVVAFINGELADAGVSTRFATKRIPGEERTSTAGGKTISLGKAPDQWAFAIKPNGETVSFAASATAGAVYMSQGVGDPNPDGRITTDDGVLRQQLLKFQTDTASLDAPTQVQSEANWVDGRLFAQTLGPEVKTVRATKVGADGSVYMLADIAAATGNQEIKGEQDVALLKYDQAGNLVYSRTIGASDSATGLGLALSADGKIAVAGSVNGVLNGAQNGPLNSGSAGIYAGQSDSFVTVFNADGEELWTQRRGARQADEASQLAFGADGTVYVAGRSQSIMPGSGGQIGGWDGYVEAFAPPDALGVVTTKFAQSFGSAGTDKPAGMVLDGTSLVIAAVEDGRAVLRRFDISSGAPVLTATRDLGALAGGEITGLALDGGELVIAGSSGNPGLSAGAVTRAHAGGLDAFAARLSADLSAGPGDAIAYYGGTGDDRATALSVAGGQVWIAGSAGTDLPGQPAVGKKDGFLAQLDIATGAVDWSRRFTGKDGFAAPTSIAVDPNGASVLDRIGLPKGELDLTDSQKLTAVTALRAGDQFTVRLGSGRTQTVTIDANDTLDTLATKIRRASGFQAKVTLSVANGVRRLTVEPQSQQGVIEFGPGKADRNALELLGIPEGVVRKTVEIGGKMAPADRKGQIYGLSLPADLTLDNANEVKHTLAELAASMTVVRNIYKDLVAAASPRSQATATGAGKTGGQAPAYLTAQIANYQAALSRLTGG